MQAYGESENFNGRPILNLYKSFVICIFSTFWYSWTFTRRQVLKIKKNEIPHSNKIQPSIHFFSLSFYSFYLLASHKFAETTGLFSTALGYYVHVHIVAWVLVKLRKHEKEKKVSPLYILKVICMTG